MKILNSTDYDERRVADDQYASSGDESFDMTSVSQVGLPPASNQHFHHRGNQQQFVLPTVEEAKNPNDTDPLLDTSSLGNQQGYHRNRRNHGSATNFSVTSYNNHTGDSGMSAGVSSNVEDAGVVRRIAGLDEKFVARAVSPQQSAVSVHSGHNSTASSCWQFQKPGSHHGYHQQQVGRSKPSLSSFKGGEAKHNFYKNFDEKNQAKAEEFPGQFQRLSYNSLEHRIN